MFINAENEYKENKKQNILLKQNIEKGVIEIVPLAYMRGRTLNNAFVILDEAQRIKNWKTRTAREVKKITSPYALVLTGTPLENKLEDLYSIIQFIDPFRLGSLYKFLEQHQIKNDHGKVVGYKNLNAIKNYKR